MDALVIFFAKYVVFILVMIAGVYWLTLPKKQKVQMLVFGAITAVITLALTRIGGALYYDSRPFVDLGVAPIIPHEANNGFPSDHAALAFAVAATVCYMNKKMGAVLVVMALLVGGSRVIGHIHSPTDILGSIIFVSAAYGAAWYLTPLVMRKLPSAYKE